MKKFIFLIAFLFPIIAKSQEGSYQAFHFVEVDSGIVFKAGADTAQADTFYVMLVTKKNPKKANVYIQLPKYSGTILTSGDTLDFSNALIRASAIYGGDIDSTWTQYIEDGRILDSIRISVIGQKVDLITKAVMDTSGAGSLWAMASAAIEAESNLRYQNDQLTLASADLHLSTQASALDTKITNGLAQQTVALTDAKTDYGSKIDLVNGNVSTMQSTINSHTSTINAQGAQINLATTAITQESSDRTAADGTLTAAINLKASTAQLNTASGRIDSVSSNLRIEANKITSKVEQTTFNTLQGVVNTHSTQISQNTTDITLKSDIAYVNLAHARVDSLKGGLVVANNNITSTVQRLTTDEGNTSNAITQINQRADSIHIMARKDSLISFINVSPYAVTIKADKISIDGTTTFTDSKYNPVIARDSAVLVAKIQSWTVKDSAIAVAANDASIKAVNAEVAAEGYAATQANNVWQLSQSDATTKAAQARVDAIAAASSDAQTKATSARDAAIADLVAKLISLDTTTTKINGGRIQTGSILANRIDVNSLNALGIVAGSVSTTWLNAQTISATQIGAGTIAAGVSITSPVIIGNMFGSFNARFGSWSGIGAGYSCYLDANGITWSSGRVINDTKIQDWDSRLTQTDKTNLQNSINGKASINDTNIGGSTTWSSEKMNSTFAGASSVNGTFNVMNSDNSTTWRMTITNGVITSMVSN